MNTTHDLIALQAALQAAMLVAFEEMGERAQELSFFSVDDDAGLAE